MVKKKNKPDSLVPASSVKRTNVKAPVATQTQLKAQRVMNPRQSFDTILKRFRTMMREAKNMVNGVSIPEPWDVDTNTAINEYVVKTGGWTMAEFRAAFPR